MNRTSHFLSIFRTRPVDHALGSVLSIVQKRVPTSWETLQQVGNARFWSFLMVFYQSSFLGLWFPVLGFLIIFSMNWLLKSQRTPSTRIAVSEARDEPQSTV